MKRFVIISFGLFIIGFLLLGKSWQMTYESHGLIADDINKMKLTNYMDPGPSGYNQVWDFSELVIKKDFEGYINNSVYSKNYNTLLKTNVVLKEFSNEFYFKGDKKSLELYGVAVNGNMIMEYEKPFVKMKYPFGYGDFFSGSYFGKYITGSTNSEIDGIYSVEADGYGTIILPNNVRIDNVLRVTTIRSYSRDVKNSGYEIKYTTTRFYAEDYRFPLVVFIKNEYTSGTKVNVSYQAAYNNDISYLLSPTSIKEENLNISGLNLYPIPFKEILNIDYNLDKDSRINIEVYNVIGEKIYSILDEFKTAGNYNLQFSFKEHGILAGTYYIKFNSDGIQTTRKVIAQ
ncbi:MAG: T9SS type A sorting domain-containing protein [Bacteroidales bacterium]|nr:T9SS type A sorting domain-containing protein [Bacteroidales bacterium]